MSLPILFLISYFLYSKEHNFNSLALYWQAVPLSSSIMTLDDSGGNSLRSMHSIFEVCYEIKQLTSREYGTQPIVLYRCYIFHPETQKIVYLSPWSLPSNKNAYEVKYDGTNRILYIKWQGRIIVQLNEDELNSDQTPDLRNLLDSEQPNNFSIKL